MQRSPNTTELLDCSPPTLRTSWSASSQGRAAVSSNSTSPASVGTARRPAQRAEQRVRERWIGQAEHLVAVVCDAVRQLVELAPALGELGLEEGEHALRRQGARVDDATARERARLGSEPALLADELRQRLLAGHSSTRSR